MNKRAVLYARVSSDDRGKEGRNLSGQLEMGREYALRQGYVVVAELAEDDRGASGAAFELAQLNEIRRMASAGEFDTLIVREIDRLSRNLAKQLIVEEELKRAGVEIDYVLGDYPDTPEGNLQKNIKASIAEYERLKIAERNTRGRRQKVKAGNVIVHGRPPFGYRLAEGNGRTMLEINEAEAEIVRLVFEWYTEGDHERGPMSMYAISQRLTELEIPTMGDKDGVLVHKRGRHGKWHRSVVRRILINETYAGTWYYSKAKKANGVTIKNDRENWLSVDVPPIVERDTWELAQRKRETNKVESLRNTKHDYLLRQRAFCGSCGTRLFCRSGPGKYAYYSCSVVHDHDRLKTCEMNKGFRVDHVDPAIWNWIESILSDPDELKQGLISHQALCKQESGPIWERLKIVDGLIDNNRLQLNRLLDLYLSGDFPKEMLAERKNRLETTIEALERESCSLVVQLEQRQFTQQQIKDLVQFTAEVAQGLEVAKDNFTARRRIIEMLNVQATLTIEDGQKVAYVQCSLSNDGGVLPVAPQSS